jgi:hypothetical protein
MILNIIIGSLIFSIIVYGIYNIFGPKTVTNITTTLSPTTTNSIITTTSIPTTTNKIGMTTSIPTTTTFQPKTRKTFFQAGQGGIPTRVINDWAQAPGGAGGILINNQGPISQNGYGSYNTGGPGGTGYGSGGGASTFCEESGGYCDGAGSGSPGFVYLVQDDILFTSDTLYTIQNSFLINTFILMGGGACGTYNGVVSRDLSFGGSCGQIVIRQFRGNLKGVQLSIKVGKGGVMQIIYSRAYNIWKSYTGENSTINFTFSGNKTEYIAYGAEPPNNNIKGENIPSQYTPLAIGGYYNYTDEIGNPGGTIPQSFIDNMNSINPNPTI